MPANRLGERVTDVRGVPAGPVPVRLSHDVALGEQPASNMAARARSDTAAAAALLAQAGFRRFFLCGVQRRRLAQAGFRRFFPWRDLHCVCRVRYSCKRSSVR